MAADPGRPQPVTPPCLTSPGSSAELGNPTAEAPATFETDGSALYVTARRFEHGGVLDPKTGLTGIYLGSSATTPGRDANGHITATVYSVAVREGTWSRLDVRPGGYWLVSTQGGDVVLLGCTSGAVTNPRPSGGR